MDKILEVLNNAKLTIATIAVIITSLVGGFKMANDYFVTQAQAETTEIRITNDVQSRDKKIVTDAQTQIQQLKSISNQNTLMILEIQASRFEDKMKTEELTSREKLRYERILKSIEKFTTPQFVE